MCVQGLFITAAASCRPTGMLGVVAWHTTHSHTFHCRSVCCPPPSWHVKRLEQIVRDCPHRTVLCCAVLCCAVLCCAVLCCAVLCCAVL
jgi:hypothetical protein